MRKIVNVCGVQRHAGISKTTGKPYDFTELHFLYDDDYIDGVKAANALVDQSVIGERKILVDDHLELVFQVYRNKVFVDAIL